VAGRCLGSAARTPDAAVARLGSTARPRPAFISKNSREQGRFSEDGRYADKRCSRIFGCPYHHRLIIEQNCMWKDCLRT
jgi:hypothetical protein